MVYNTNKLSVYTFIFLNFDTKGRIIMNKKQLIGLVVAGMVFAFVGAISILINHAAETLFPSKSIIDSLAQADSGFILPTKDFIGVIDVQGNIMDSGSTSMFDTVSYDHQGTIELIEALKNSNYNKGIFLTVNSPGGGVYESDELYLKLKEYKDKTGRPIWTYMETQACSGGYYIAMASDNIVANRNTWTGSIGVIFGIGNYKELAEKIGYKEVYFTSGDNKTMGSPFLDITAEQEEIFKSLVDEAYEQFVGIVAEGRSMDVSVVKPIADGRIYTAQQALDLDLIDGIDTYENTLKIMKKETKASTIYEVEQDLWGFASLFGAAKELKPRSDAEVMSQLFEQQGNGVPMYYAYPGQY